MDMKWMLVALACASCGKKAAAPTDLGTAAHPMGAIKDVRVGMTADQVKAAAPTLVFDKAGEIASLDKNGEIATVWLIEGHVSFLQVEFLHRNVDDLWKAWGGHGLDLGQDKHRFVDAKDHLRADVSVLPKGFAVHFTNFVPYATQLAGADPNAIDGVEVLGRPLTDVVADFKKAGATIKGSPDHPSVDLAPNEFSGELAGLDLVPDESGVVTSWAMIGTVFNPTPEMRKQIIATYAKRWSEPVTLGQRMTFNKEPWIFADESLMISGWTNGLVRMGYAAGSGAGSGSGSGSGSAHAP